MKVSELNRDQLTQLKARYYDDRHPDGISWGELANADDLVTDEEIIEAYTGVEFSPDDFTGGGEE